MKPTSSARVPLPLFEERRNVRPETCNVRRETSLPSARQALERRRWLSRDDVLVLYPGPDAAVVRGAGLGDARQIHALLDGFADQGLVLRRTFDQVCRSIRDFVVAEENGRIVGCGTLRIYSETLAEVGALAVATDHHGRGIGARVVRALLDEARAFGIRRVFALTLQDGFFHKLGFATVDVREFPQKIAADCAQCDRRHACNEIAVARDLHDDVITAEA